MNCKIGDMAFIIGIPNLYGIIIKCIVTKPAGFNRMDPSEGIQWETDTTFITKLGREVNTMPDKYLKPIEPLTDFEKTEFLRDMRVASKILDSSVTTKLSNLAIAKARIKLLQNK